MNHADGVDCGICLVRPWRISDLTALAHHLNNRNIWLNLRDRLPFPYTLADGRAWLEHASLENPITNFAVEIQGEIVGGIGLVLKDDVERGTAELGYWLAEPFWGRGLGTAAVKAFSNWTLTFFSSAVFLHFPSPPISPRGEFWKKAISNSKAFSAVTSSKTVSSRTRQFMLNWRLIPNCLSC